MAKEQPAILGGDPLFNSTMGIIRPVFDRYAKQISTSIHDILKTNLVSGVNIYTKKLEERLKEFLDVKHVVAVSSCTSGMILTLQALNLRNAKIIIPSFTFSATVHMLHWNLCIPQFVDIDQDNFNITADIIQEAITPETKAILGVHLYGNPVDINAIEEIAEDSNLLLLFDGAHALGSQYRGKAVGGAGTATAYSASPTKVLSTIEGGFVSTDDDLLAKRIEIARNYGNYPDYTCETPGLNARLSELYALVGLVQLDDVHTFVSNRNHYAQQYKKELSILPGINFQKVDSRDLSTYKDFSVIVDEDKFGLTRDEVAIALKKENIQTKFYFYPPAHHLKPYSNLISDEDLPNTIYLSENVLSIPIYNIMSDLEVENIIKAFHRIYEYASEIRKVINSKD